MSVAWTLYIIRQVNNAGAAATGLVVNLAAEIALLIKQGQLDCIALAVGHRDDDRSVNAVLINVGDADAVGAVLAPWAVLTGWALIALGPCWANVTALTLLSLNALTASSGFKCADFIKSLGSYAPMGMAANVGLPSLWAVFRKSSE